MTHYLNRFVKIKENKHINLSAQMRMFVKLASQVLTTTIANVIRQWDRPACLILPTFAKCLTNGSIV